jgi:N-acetylmuramoyl-L-alanine amidase
MQTGLFHELAGVNDRVLNRGIKTAPLVVLVGTRMPAILAEVSCVSNADEARRLATPEYRSEVARGLSAGLRAYIDPSPAVPAAAARRGAAPPASKGNS